MADRIAEFWEWFTSRNDQLHKWLTTGHSKEVSEEIQSQIRTLSLGIGWEIGPGINKKYFLAFTLNGDPNNLDLVTNIIRFAPESPIWEFRAGRPRRDYNRQIVFRNQIGQEVEVNLQDWRYVLTAFDNNRFFDISVATRKRLECDDRAKEQILRTAVQAALGEFDTLKYVDRIEFVDEPDNEWEERSTPFKYLADHIDSLANSSQT
jgi:hypothetical protein